MKTEIELWATPGNIKNNTGFVELRNSAYELLMKRKIDNIDAITCITRVEDQFNIYAIKANIDIIEEILMREFHAKNSGVIPESEIDDAAAKHIIACDVRAEIGEDGVKYFCEYEPL